MSHKSVTVSVKVYTCQCAKCSWPWTTRTDSLPIACPNCRSTEWDKDVNGRPVEMTDDQPKVIKSKARKAKLAADVLGGMSTPADPPAIDPGANVSVPEATKPPVSPGIGIWADPNHKGRACPYCSVIEGQKHRAYCSWSA